MGGESGCLGDGRSGGLNLHSGGGYALSVKSCLQYKRETTHRYSTSPFHYLYPPSFSPHPLLFPSLTISLFDYNSLTC